MTGFSNFGNTFNPALLVIDVQEDLCPPNGSLAVGGGRDVAPVINELLSLPFALRIATRDCHPLDHVSFATTHEPPNDKPFQSKVDISNPANASQKYSIPIWPPHCVQGTPGAEIIPELESSKFDIILDKGQNKRGEMFSGFADVFGGKSPEAASLDLADTLKSHDITHVFAVGLAGDYCVKCTALDARKEGFEVYVVEQAVKSVDPGQSGWGEARKQMEKAGIHIVDSYGEEVGRVGRLRQPAGRLPSAFRVAFPV